MTHPLTDEICLAIDDNAMIDSDDWKGAMRAGADWQLEQVIKWLEETEDEQCYYDTIIYASDLKKAMRPTTQENN